MQLPIMQLLKKNEDSDRGRRDTKKVCMETLYEILSSQFTWPYETLMEKGSNPCQENVSSNY